MHDASPVAIRACEGGKTMNSAQMREKLEELIAEIEEDKDSAAMNDTDPYTWRVFDSILFQCLGMKEEILKIRQESCSFFSHFSAAEKEAVKRTDEGVWSAMDGVWLEEQSWCCACDFEDDVQDWIYVTGIYEQLIWALEYAEEKFGLFDIYEGETGD